jgi:endonuclease YncB( thermonuclease family)
MKKTQKRRARRLTKRNIGLMIAMALVVGALLITNRQENVLAGQASVIDGDTIRVAGQKVRLQGLAAPELSEPGGIEAKNAMIELVSNRRVSCELDGTTSYDRVVGICYAAGLDMAAELVRRGLARDCPRYSGGRYGDLEPASAEALPLPGYCVP